jgi:hypothetical protein
MARRHVCLSAMLYFHDTTTRNENDLMIVCSHYAFLKEGYIAHQAKSGVKILFYLFIFLFHIVGRRNFVF